jgi:hypothetical protein
MGRARPVRSEGKGFVMWAFGVRRAGARGFVLRTIAHPLFTVLLVLAVMLSIMPSAGQSALANGGTTYWVDVATGSDTNPGTESEPFKTLTKACSVVGSLDTIMVRPGTYNEGSGETFPLFPKGASLMSTGGAAVTVIQGNGTGWTVAAQNFTEGDVISGFTFTGGRRAVNVYLNWATGPDSPRIEDNVFQYNDSAPYGGGALSLYTSDPGEYRPLVQRNVFRWNAGGSGGGGAIRVSGYVAATISENEFVENTADDGGAVILLTNAVAVEIVDNLFSGNEASGSSRGGAIFMTSSSADEHRIANNSFHSNIANDPAGEGGALWLSGVNAVISGNDCSTNFATRGGFGYLKNSIVNAENNLIFGGSSSGRAAAWYVDDAELNERNDTVAENVAGTGIVGTPVPITYATLGSTLTITNSIYWNEPNTLEIEGADALSFSCIRDTDIANPAKGNTVGAGIIFGDPLLVDPATRDARLSFGSPCIDTGNPAAAPATDYFGTARPLDGDLDGIAKPDMGFHEYAPGFTAVQHDAAGVTFDRFVTGYNVAYSGGGYVYGRWTGTKLQARFTGSKVRWIGPKQPSYGKADVYIDGVKRATVDCYASAAEKTTSAVLWESATLTDAAHTLEIRLLGQKNAASSGYVVVLDRFEVDGADPKGGGIRHDEKSGTLSGPWIYGANSAYIAKGYNYSRYTNATFTKSFTGTRVAWIGPKTPGYGRAKVYIDGKLIGTVSQYGPTGWRYKVWESASLPYGNHTIKIVPTATKDAASTGTNIVIDAIDVR